MVYRAASKLPSVGVIGGGPGGLTSAMLLASKGFNVTLFEKGANVGGRSAPIMVGHSKLDTGEYLEYNES